MYCLFIVRSCIHCFALAGAVEREDFEEADALSERATRLEGEVKDWQGEVRGAEEKEERLMAEMRALAEEEDRVEMEGVEELMAMYKVRLYRVPGHSTGGMGWGWGGEEFVQLCVSLTFSCQPELKA